MSTTNAREGASMDYDKFFAAYVECALWASLDESDESGGKPMDANYSAEDIAPDALVEMQADCEAFINGNEQLLENIVATKAGLDFWLTRNHHGAGFWDRGLGAVGEQLSEAAHAFGECYLYVGDDGKIYVS